MTQEPTGKFPRPTRKELGLFLSLGSVLVCVIALSAIYILYTSRRASRGAEHSGFPTLAPSTTPAPYMPAPSLTGWVLVSGTPATITPTVTATRTRAPTSTPTPTFTPKPTRTPLGAPTATPIPPTPTIQLGTSGNPVPIGTAFTIPDLGTLTVIRSSWVPGQTGLVTVELSFMCQRPAGQVCDTSTLVLTAIGGSGSRYKRTLDAAIPEPAFGSGPSGLVSSGGTEAGNAGFIIQNSESSLLMQAQVIQRAGQSYFLIGPTAPAP